MTSASEFAKGKVENFTREIVNMFLLHCAEARELTNKEENCENGSREESKMCDCEHTNYSIDSNSVMEKEDDQLQCLSEESKETELMKTINNVKGDSKEDVHERDIHNTCTNSLRQASNIRRPQKSARPTRERNVHARTTSFPQNEVKPLTLCNKNKTKSTNSSFYYASNGEKELPPIRHSRQQSVTTSHGCKSVTDDNFETSVDSTCRSYPLSLTSIEREDATMPCLVDHEHTTTVTTTTTTKEKHSELENHHVNNLPKDKRNKLWNIAHDKNDVCDVLCTTFEAFYARCKSINNIGLKGLISEQINKSINTEGQECIDSRLSKAEHLKEGLAPMTLSSSSSSLSSGEILRESVAPIIFSNSVYYKKNENEKVDKKHNINNNKKYENAIALLRLPQRWEIAVVYITLQTSNSPMLAARLTTDKLTHLLESWNYSVNELLNACEHSTYFRKLLLLQKENTIQHTTNVINNNNDDNNNNTIGDHSKVSSYDNNINDVGHKLNDNVNDEKSTSSKSIHQIHQKEEELEQLEEQELESDKTSGKEELDRQIVATFLPPSKRTKKSRTAQSNVVDSVSTVCQELFDSIITERNAANNTVNKNFEKNYGNDKKADCQAELRICRIKVELELLVNELPPPSTSSEQKGQELVYSSNNDNNEWQEEYSNEDTGINFNSNLTSSYLNKREYVHKILNNAFLALLQRSASYLTNTYNVGHSNTMCSDHNSENTNSNIKCSCTNSNSEQACEELYQPHKKYHTESWEEYTAQALAYRHAINITETESANNKTYLRYDDNNGEYNTSNDNNEKKEIIPFALHYQLNGLKENTTAEHLMHKNANISHDCNLPSLSESSSLLTIIVFCIVKRDATCLDANNEQSMMNWDKEVTYATLTQLFPREFIFANHARQVSISHTNLTLAGNSINNIINDNIEDNSKRNNYDEWKKSKNKYLKRSSSSSNNNSFTTPHKTRIQEKEQEQQQQEKNLYNELNAFRVVDVSLFREMVTEHMTPIDNAYNINDMNSNDMNCTTNNNVIFVEEKGKNTINMKMQLDKKIDNYGIECKVQSEPTQTTPSGVTKERSEEEEESQELKEELNANKTVSSAHKCLEEHESADENNTNDSKTYYKLEESNEFICKANALNETITTTSQPTTSTATTNNNIIKSKVQILPNNFIHSITSQMLLLKETIYKAVEMFVFLSHPVLTTESSSSNNPTSNSTSEWIPITIYSQNDNLSHATNEIGMMSTPVLSDVILPSTWLYNNFSNAIIKPNAINITGALKNNNNGNEQTVLEPLHKSDEHVESKLHTSSLTKPANNINVQNNTNDTTHNRTTELTNSSATVINEKVNKEEKREISEACVMKDGRWFTFMTKLMKKQCKCVEEQIAKIAMPTGKLHELTSLKALSAFVRRELYKELLAVQDEFCAHMTLITVNSVGNSSKGESNVKENDTCMENENLEQQQEQQEQLETKLQSTQQVNLTTLLTKKSTAHVRPLVHVFQLWRSIEQMMKATMIKSKNSKSSVNNDVLNTQHHDKKFNSNEHVTVGKVRCDNGNSNNENAVTDTEHDQEWCYHNNNNNNNDDEEEEEEVNSGDKSTLSSGIYDVKGCSKDSTTKCMQPEYILEFIDPEAVTEFETNVQNFNKKLASCRSVIDEVYTHYKWLIDKVICTCALPYLLQVYNELVNEHVEFNKLKEEFASLNITADVAVETSTPLRITRRRNKMKNKESITANVNETHVLTGNAETSIPKDTELNEIDMQFKKEGELSTETRKQTRNENKSSKSHLECSEEQYIEKYNRIMSNEIDTSNLDVTDHECVSHTVPAMATSPKDDIHGEPNSVHVNNKGTAAECHVDECTNTIKEVKKKKSIKSRKIEILTSIKKSDERNINTLSVKVAKRAEAAAATTVINGKSHNESALLNTTDTNVDNINSSKEKNMCNHLREISNKDDIDKKEKDKDIKSMGKVDSVMLNAAGNIVENNNVRDSSTFSLISSEDSCGVKLKKEISSSSSSITANSSTSTALTPTTKSKKTTLHQHDKANKNVASSSTTTASKSKTKSSTPSSTATTTKVTATTTNAVKVNTQKAQAIRRQIVQQILTDANTTKRQKAAQLYATTSSLLSSSSSSSSSTHLQSKSGSKRNALTLTQICLAFAFVGVAVLAVLIFFL